MKLIWNGIDELVTAETNCLQCKQLIKREDPFGVDYWCNAQQQNIPHPETHKCESFDHDKGEE